MKSAFALALFASVLGAAPLTAQVTMPPPASLLAQSIAREAVRLAAEPPAGSSAVGAVEPDRARSDWQNVRKLAPGIEIVVTVKGSQPGRRRLVQADDVGITILDLMDPELPPVVTATLFEAVSRHPEYFVSAQHGSVSVMDSGVRLAPDGVFLLDQKVADLGQIVPRIARTDVAEIRAKVKHGSVVGAIGMAAGGALIGSAVALNLAFNVSCQPSCGGVEAAAVVSAIGIPVAMGFVGYHAFSHTREDVIYRAP